MKLINKKVFLFAGLILFGLNSLAQNLDCDCDRVSYQEFGYVTISYKDYSGSNKTYQWYSQYSTGEAMCIPQNFFREIWPKMSQAFERALLDDPTYKRLLASVQKENPSITKLGVEPIPSQSAGFGTVSGFSNDKTAEQIINLRVDMRPFIAEIKTCREVENNTEIDSKESTSEGNRSSDNEDEGASDGNNSDGSTSDDDTNDNNNGSNTTYSQAEVDKATKEQQEKEMVETFTAAFGLLSQVKLNDERVRRSNLKVRYNANKLSQLEAGFEFANAWEFFYFSSYIHGMKSSINGWELDEDKIVSDLNRDDLVYNGSDIFTRNEDISSFGFGMDLNMGVRFDLKPKKALTPYVIGKFTTSQGFDSYGFGFGTQLEINRITFGLDFLKTTNNFSGALESTPPDLIAITAKDIESEEWLRRSGTSYSASRSSSSPLDFLKPKLAYLGFSIAITLNGN